MNKLLVFIVMIAFCGLNEAFGQWSYNGINIYNSNTGDVGIGNSSPSTLLHVAKNMTEPTITVQNLGGIGGATYTMMDNVSGANWKFKATNSGGFKIRDHANSLDVIVIEPNSSANAIYINSDGNVGINDATPLALLDVNYDGYSFARFGYTSVLNNYFNHREVEADGDGQSALYAWRTRDTRNDGLDYSLINTNTAIKGYCYFGDSYTFGTAGYSGLNFNRSGGIFGAKIDGASWGSLGYKNSGGTLYGGYFSTYSSGSGKSSQPTMIGIGMGAWGDLIGADIHGKVYGTYTEGGNYALFSNGTVYNNDLEVHLQENGTETNTVLYTYVSTDVCVQTSGIAILSAGAASIAFDPAFTSIVSSNEPVVVTVTPVGESNGVHLANVTSSGFTVVENSNGRSNVTVNYIAIGRRVGYENPNLPLEVINADYITKLARGLHADADTQGDGEGLYYENGRLVVGIHPSTLPDPNKPNEEEPIPVE